MKKFFPLLLLASFAFLPFRASAFAGLELGGYGSWWKPSDLKEGHGGGVVARGQLLGFLGGDARIGYFSFSDPDVDMIPAEAALMLRFPLPVIKFFAGAGGGYYQFSGEKGFSLDDEAGYFGSAGIEAALGDWLLFFEWRYNFLEPKVDSAGGGYAEGDKIDFSGSSFSLGVTYAF